MYCNLRQLLLFIATVSLLTTIPLLAGAQEVTVFGSQNNSNGADHYVKANRYEVTDNVNLDQFEIRYRTYSNNRDATFAVWQVDVFGNFQVIWQESLTLNSYNWAWRAVTPDIPLDAGETYAIGMWFPDTVYYAFDNNDPAPNGQPSWGNITAYRSLYSWIFPSTLTNNSWYSPSAYNQRLTVSLNVDADGDGFFSDVDCDDTDPNIYPGAIEACDGLDTDCDGALRPDEIDLDNDGFSECEGDCDNTNTTTYPGAPEWCDGEDNNCDGAVDEGLTEDVDGDGFSSVGSCEGSADDCDDDDSSIYPGATEAPCDGVDTDCDGNLHPDEADLDGDGVTVCDGDCDDSDGSISPDAAESCNGLDDNCDGNTDEGLTFDLDGDGYTSVGSCEGSADDCGDEDETIFPGADELCDRLDNDCSGDVPADEIDEDEDGYAPCEGDCDDTLDTVWPGATEDCGNGIDDNCNGEIDEATDEDGDGFACDDCDDTNADVFPGAEEAECDGLDTDCDGELHPDEFDGDGDGITTCDGDCDDTNPNAYPGAKEDICDEVDIDCDGELPTREGCDDPPNGDDDDDGSFNAGSLSGSGCQDCGSSVRGPGESPAAPLSLLLLLVTVASRRRRYGLRPPRNILLG